MKTKIILPFLLLVLNVYSQDLPEKKTKHSTNINLQVAYRIGSNNAEILYESDVASEVLPKKDKTYHKLTVQGTSGLNGKVGVTSSETMRYLAQDNSAFTDFQQNETMLFLMGEPVPGAEVYIELEPDDEPLVNLGSGSGSFEDWVIIEQPSDTLPRVLEMTVMLTKESFPLIQGLGSSYVGSGIYIFGVETSFNSKRYFNEFAVVVNEPTADIAYFSGPFSQSLSNIEDNGRRINPNEQIRVNLGAKVYLVNSFTRVNNYDINNDRINRMLSGSGIGGSKTAKNPLKQSNIRVEPVPGAKISIALEANNEQIANVITDINGEFVFSIVNPPAVGNFVFNIIPTKAFALQHNLSLTNRIKVKAELRPLKNGIFKGILNWIEDENKAQNKGAFAVSGKNST